MIRIQDNVPSIFMNSKKYKVNVFGLTSLIILLQILHYFCNKSIGGGYYSVHCPFRVSVDFEHYSSFTGGGLFLVLHSAYYCDEYL